MKRKCWGSPFRKWWEQKRSSGPRPAALQTSLRLRAVLLGCGPDSKTSKGSLFHSRHLQPPGREVRVRERPGSPPHDPAWAPWSQDGRDQGFASHQMASPGEGHRAQRKGRVPIQPWAFLLHWLTPGAHPQHLPDPGGLPNVCCDLAPDRREDTEVGGRGWGGHPRVAGRPRCPPPAAPVSQDCRWGEPGRAQEL